VVDSATGALVDGGFMTLIDESGQEVARTLTDRRGRFSLTAPQAGHFKLQSLRIGYRAWQSPLFELSAGQALEYHLTVIALPVRLAEVEVTAEARCEVGPEGSARTAVVWEEARKALAAASWTANRRDLHYTMRLYERDLDRRARNVVKEQQTTTSGFYTTPFQSAPPEQLAEQGYLRHNWDGTATFFAPDADVLLSESFQRTHCFKAVRDRQDHPGLIGLAFEPVAGHSAVDVAGALWLDESAAELRTIQYRYTRLPPDIRDQRIGGELEFMPVPSGAWIVREWFIRMPAVGLRLGLGPVPDSVVTGFRESGGEVIRLATPDGSEVYTAEFATLIGSVFDSTTGRPLAGALVTIVGTDGRTLTRWDGTFHITGPLQGEYAVSMSHPSLDSLGIMTPGTTVEFSRGEVARVFLAVPPVSRIRAALCPGESWDESVRAIVGVVRNGQTGAPVPAAQVVVSWRSLEANRNVMQATDLEAVAVTDGSGSFTLCSLPTGTDLTLRATHGEGLSASVGLKFQGQSVAVGQGLSHRIRYGIWKQDLELAAPAALSASLAGTVTDSASGEALRRAEVEALGTGRTTVTDSAGGFTMDSLPPGPLRVRARHVGYASRDYEVALQQGQHLELTGDVLALTSLNLTVLDPIVIAAERDQPRDVLLRPFTLRREEGFGSFLTQEEFESWNPRETTDVLRRMRGVRVRPNPSYGVRGDTQRYLIESSRMVDRIQGAPCPVVYFMNGLYYGNSSDFDIDVMLAVTNIAAIEVYSGASQIPPVYNRPGAGCGVIAFWTR
jgi:hypothetical protein